MTAGAASGCHGAQGSPPTRSGRPLSAATPLTPSPGKPQLAPPPAASISLLFWEGDLRQITFQFLTGPVHRIFPTIFKTIKITFTLAKVKRCMPSVRIIYTNTLITTCIPNAQKPARTNTDDRDKNKTFKKKSSKYDYLPLNIQRTYVGKYLKTVFLCRSKTKQLRKDQHAKTYGWK